MLAGFFGERHRKGRDPADILTLWRNRIFLTIFSSAILIGSLPFAGNIRIAVNSGDMFNIFLYSLAYIVGILIVFGRAIPFRYRAWIGLILFYVLGVSSLLTFGRMGSGRLWLVTFSVLATLLLGLRAGVLTLFFNVITYTIWVTCFHFGYVTLVTAAAENMLPLKTSIFTFFFINSIMTISLGVFVSVLEKKINKEQQLSNDLKVANKRLEKDIAVRESIEKALRKSENRYKTLTQNLEVGIFRHSGGEKSVFLEVNPAMLKMFGFKHRKEINGLDITNFFQNKEEKVKFQEKLRRQGYVRNEELHLKDRDDGTMTCEISAVAIKDKKGRVKFYDGVIEDITKRKQLESMLRQAQKLEALGTLAGGVAHDLNNILSGIVSYPDLILMDLPADSPLRQPIQAIQNSGKKAATVVQDLLTLARRGVMVSKVVNLNQVISGYIDSPECRKLKSFHPNVEIRTHFEPALLNLMGSPVHLAKTVMNLVSNAAEAMPDGGQILIQTQNRYFDLPLSGHENFKEGDYVVLSVSDAGIGIAPEDINRIFEPFYTKKVMGRSGTGLGMAVVWGTVKDHYGYIDVESLPGKGTTFKIIFPATRELLTTDKNDVCIDYYRGNGERILVVDDVEEQREVASRILSSLGYKVDMVNSGEEAVEFMSANSADLVLLDMIMHTGELDGLETYCEIKKNHPEQKAIITSGFSETKRVKKAQMLGVGQYVLKPYTLEKIGMAIKKELIASPKAA
jgi:PAS domain S-box-containing protein